MATASSLIPTGISLVCSNALNALNSNTKIQSTQMSFPYAESISFPSPELVHILLGPRHSVFDPDLRRSHDPMIRSALSNISSSCSHELKSNRDVIALYDATYMLSPFKSALCSKSDSGSYCILLSSANSSSSSSSSSTGAAQQAQQHLATPSGTVNATTFTSPNVGFLFLSWSTSAIQCTTCTRSIMTTWINYMSNFPYAPGVSNSGLFPHPVEGVRCHWPEAWEWVFG
ncbi:hypothetical protein GYMLUDRAFT_69966 [Collybiopsis luxurians FD-317 M1]|nr:hypothetical protein GYMLUDRAFT_69966 [Collybiopsis luxurians FD-317 M1]